MPVHGEALHLAEHAAFARAARRAEDQPGRTEADGADRRRAGGRSPPGASMAGEERSPLVPRSPASPSDGGSPMSASPPVAMTFSPARRSPGRPATCSSVRRARDTSSRRHADARYRPRGGAAATLEGLPRQRRRGQGLPWRRRSSGHPQRRRPGLGKRPPSRLIADCRHLRMPCCFRPRSSLRNRGPRQRRSPTTAPIMAMADRLSARAGSPAARRASSAGAPRRGARQLRASSTSVSVEEAPADGARGQLRRAFFFGRWGHRRRARIGERVELQLRRQPPCPVVAGDELHPVGMVAVRQRQVQRGRDGAGGGHARHDRHWDIGSAAGRRPPRRKRLKKAGSPPFRLHHALRGRRGHAPPSAR